MAKNLIKYQNMEQFIEEQGNPRSVESIVPGVAYVKDGSTPGPTLHDSFGETPDNSVVFYNEDMAIDPGDQLGL